MVYCIFNYGYDHHINPMLYAICESREDAVRMIEDAGDDGFLFPHRNIRGYIEVELGKPIKIDRDKIQVLDKEKFNRILEMIGG